MKKLLIASIVTIAAMSASAQSLKVSTGSSSGTYSTLTKQLSEQCKDSMQVTEINSTGSLQNLDRIIDNSVNAGFVQADSIFFRSRTEDLSNIKTLVAFHPEEVHVLTLAQSNLKEGGTLGFGAKQVVFNTINDLAGRTVVAAGGSYVTAQVIRLQTEINFNVFEVDKVDDAVEMVRTGRAAAAVIVGGQPLGTINALDRTFKLLEFPEATVAKLKNIYKPSRLSYGKLGAAGVSSVSTDALLVARVYKTPKMVEGMSKLRTCILDNIDVLAEETGKHPAWSKMSRENTGKWAYMELTAPTKKK